MTVVDCASTTATAAAGGGGDVGAGTFDKACPTLTSGFVGGLGTGSGTLEPPNGHQLPRRPPELLFCFSGAGGGGAGLSGAGGDGAECSAIEGSDDCGFVAPFTSGAPFGAGLRKLIGILWSSMLVCLSVIWTSEGLATFGLASGREGLGFDAVFARGVPVEEPLLGVDLPRGVVLPLLRGVPADADFGGVAL